MMDFDEISHYLDMKVDVIENFIFIYQTIYIKKILNCFKMFNCNFVLIFMITDLLSIFNFFIINALSSQKE